MEKESKLPELEILYEDNHLIAVNKPCGMLVQGDDTQDESLFDRTKMYIKIKYEKPGNVYLGLVHRLDRPASGCVVLAKTSKAASRLSDQFRRNIPEKIYRVLVHKCPEKNEGKLINYLKQKQSKKNIMEITKDKKSGKECILNYKVIKRDKKHSELEVKLETGRKHQIRVQLAGINCPILGDLKYGSSEKVADGRGISLHAEKLTIEHPTKKEKLTFTAPLPGYWK
ncbi:MAG: RluA family pseudouridine synthase [Planctomycetota bacterium]